MKKYNILKYLVVGLLAMTFTQSCTDLEEEIFSELTSDNFPTTEEQFIAALGATYTSLYGWAGHNGLMSLNEVSTDEIIIPQRGSDWFDGGQWLRVHRHEYNANEESINNGWNFVYGGVNNCNRVIELFETLVKDGKVEESVSAAFTAEVRVLRALFYYWALDSYGNVPIVASFSGGSAAPSNATRAEVFNFVEKELNDNVPKLSKAKDESTYARFNFYAGRALQAKLYLNAEVYTGSARYADAMAACDDIINSGAYALESNYFANFNADNSGSGENIFVIPYDNQQALGFVLDAMTLHYSSQATFNLGIQPWNGYCTLSEFYNSYDDGDLRKGEFGNQKVRGNFHAGPQYQSDGTTPITDPSAEASDPDGPEIVFTPVVNELEPNALRQAGARVGKYEFESGLTQDMNNDFPILRYSDILLMKAEAMMRSGGSTADAMALVNQVRERANAEPYASMTMDDLIAERGREMFYEGWRRSDLIRFGKYNMPWTFKPMASDASKNIFPIPGPQILANPNLKQNPGY